MCHASRLTHQSMPNVYLTYLGCRLNEGEIEELAAVYVPTTPSPTSGYLEIVPIDKLVSTDWSIDEAMNFIISGGAVAPEHVPYTNQGSD